MYTLQALCAVMHCTEIIALAAHVSDWNMPAVESCELHITVRKHLAYGDVLCFKLIMLRWDSQSFLC